MIGNARDNAARFLRGVSPLVPILLLALALRVFRLDFQPLWWDEGYSLFFATRDLGTLLARTAIDIHPPLYYALLQLWLALIGTGDVAARWLSVALGIATIPLLYALARKLFDARVALTAASLLALSPLHVYYSQEVRMYGLVTLLALASLDLFVESFASTDRRPMLAYILVTTAALYTQYYAAFIVLLEIALAFLWNRKNLKSKILAWFAIALLYLPWMLYAVPKLYAYVTAKVALEKYPPLDPVTFLAQHLAAFSTGHLTAWTWLAWASALPIALVAVGFWGWLRRRGEVKTWSAVTLSLGIPLASGYLVNLVYPFHPIRFERLLLFAAPAFYLLAALGICTLWTRRASLGALALGATALISAASLYDFYTVPRYPQDDYRPLIAEIQSLAQPGDNLLAVYPWQIGYLETYYAGAPLTVTETPNDTWINDSAQRRRDLDTLLEKNPRVWLMSLQTLGRILEDALDADLRAQAYSVVDSWHGTTRLELFVRAPDPPLPRAPRPIAFEQGVTLADWGISTEPVAAGQDIVRARFAWSARAAEEFKASLRLLDRNGDLWAQDDRELARDWQRIGFAVPLGTPPGEYEIRLAVYRAQDGTRLSQSDATLARVQVVAPAQPNLAAIPHRATIDLTEGVRLLGYDAPRVWRPGEATPITLFWQATRALPHHYVVRLQALDARGNVFAETRAAPARDIYPTTRWQPGEIVRDPQTLMLHGDAPDGDYRLVVALVDSADDARASPREIGKLTAQGRAHYFGAPTPAQTMDVRFGELARVIGYDLYSDPRATRLVLYWHALASTQTSYTVFVHILDADGTRRAQRDQIPGAGAFPTTTWVKGEYLADAYDIAIPRDAPPGEYTIILGMYDAATGARLAAFDALGQPIGDHSKLPTRISLP